ncbi:MAG: antibiotic biosynthesis monooxygenase family protein [Saprospiraceae bacterium]|nr:antibiotic biosynthesis monooxygenase family protein [Saprospiraceae bacterium]
MLKRIVSMRFRAGEEERFLEIFASSRGQIRGFAGCQYLELLRDRHDPQRFFTISIWQDDAALQAYRQSRLFADTWAATKALFAERAQAWSTDSIDLQA